MENAISNSSLLWCHTFIAMDTFLGHSLATAISSASSVPVFQLPCHISPSSMLLVASSPQAYYHVFFWFVGTELSRVAGSHTLPARKLSEVSSLFIHLGGGQLLHNVLTFIVPVLWKTWLLALWSPALGSACGSRWVSSCSSGMGTILCLGLMPSCRMSCLISHDFPCGKGTAGQLFNFPGSNFSADCGTLQSGALPWMSPQLPWQSLCMLLL
jgi:hypothetical protein